MSDRRPTKILILDDSLICRGVLKAVLETQGYEVVALETAVELAAVLDRERPDIALVDVFMAGLRGDQLVANAAGKQRHDCPVVLFSDRAETELAKLAQACGATGYIRKTTDGVILAREIKRIMGERQ